MKLEFEADDEAAFERAKKRLLGDFRRWLAQDRGFGDELADDAAASAGVCLDWKFGYDDGHLAYWRSDQVVEFLLEWCPRKLTLPPAEFGSIPAALADWLTFLEAHLMLDAESAPAPYLVEGIEAMTDAYPHAMNDPTKFGMAKALLAAAALDGVDTGDPGAVEGWIEDFNDRSLEERKRILPDRVFGGGQPVSRKPTLPPVALPSDEAVQESIAAAPVLEKFVALVAYIADGKRLTQKGNLTLADARALVPLLATGDRLDEQIGDTRFSTRSSAELVGLRQLFAWAKKAGLLRVARGRVITTKLASRFATNPAAAFDRVIDGLFAAGPLRSQREPSAWFAWPDVDEFLDDLVLMLLSGPYVAGAPFPLGDLVANAVEAVHEAFEFDLLAEAQVAPRIEWNVTDIMDTLVLAGLAVRDDVQRDDDSRRARGGTLSLTPAGVVTVRRLLAARGLEVPAAGRFADLAAVEFLRATERLDFPALRGEFGAWRGRRSAGDAAAEMGRAAIELAEDPGLVNLAMAMAMECGRDVAGPVLIELSSGSPIRGFARAFLVDQELIGPESLYDPADLPSFVDVLAYRMVASPHGLTATVALVGDESAQLDLMGRIWRVDSPAVTTVLDGIGRSHPSKVVAKAARKAILQHRSWRASQPPGPLV